ncbi:MAG: type II toxin-antitoxin system RelE/ParE family toxin [Phycisphaeraceae bacterium]
MARLDRTAQAERDLLEIWHFIAQDSPSAADRVVEKIGQLARDLCDTPLIGRERDELRRGLRSYPAGKYLIFYRYVKARDVVEILRIVHGSRNLRRLFRRRSTRDD